MWPRRTDTARLPKLWKYVVKKNSSVEFFVQCGVWTNTLFPEVSKWRRLTENQQASLVANPETASHGVSHHSAKRLNTCFPERSRNEDLEQFIVAFASTIAHSSVWLGSSPRSPSHASPASCGTRPKVAAARHKFSSPGSVTSTSCDRNLPIQSMMASTRRGVRGPSVRKSSSHAISLL